MTSVAIRAGARSIQVSKPDKVLFPDDGITKEDLARYYAAVAPAMLPHVRRRPIMMQRFPDGIAHRPIVQQRAPEYFPDWIARASVPKRTGGEVVHPTIDNAATLVYLAGQAVITPHVWLARADRPDRPDQIVIDLDPPDEDIALALIGARALREIVTDAGLVPFVKTSGSRGLHVVVPIRRTSAPASVAAAVESIARALVEHDPKRFTLEFRKARREGRLYVDIGRNGYGQTVVAPYAVRARPGAPVATPLHWDELAGRLRGFTLRSVPDRLRADGDPWRDMARHARALVQPKRC